MLLPKLAIQVLFMFYVLNHTVPRSGESRLGKTGGTGNGFKEIPPSRP